MRPPGIALVASVPYRGHRLYEQRLAAALSPHARVVYLDPPRPPRSLGELRERVVADGGRTVVQPAWTVPFSRRLGLRGARDNAARRAGARAARLLGGAADAVVTTGASASLDTLGARRRVLLVKDDYVAGAALIGQDPAALEAELRRAVGAADAVVAVSPVLRDRLRRFDVEAEVVPAGCVLPDDVPRGAPQGRPPRAVFLGGVSPRVRPELLRSVVDAGCELVVLGRLSLTFPDPAQRAAVEEVLGDPRVDWRGPVGPDVVAAELARADVGLVPYDASSFNAASFPLKILEYLAAGVPVVSTPLPALDWLASPHVAVHEDPATFGAAAAATGAGADESVRAATRAFAADHTWQRRAEDWLAVLGVAGAGPTGGEHA
ncbi:glycosyltransferase [Actinotalea sp. AC32]|nr:glycosyltransferase [Actinotalea sp. AC32]